nr:TonB-dependent siderophore receptor [Caldimonas sp.]
MPLASGALRAQPTMLALAALALAGPGDAAAQETLSTVHVTGHSEAPDEYRPTRSSTFTKTDTPLKEVPASVTVVPEQVMKDQAMRSLADVIRYVPGALAHQGEGNRDQFILRGVSTSADLYVDGVRDDAQVFRDLYNLERIEVLKGTAGMIFGRGGAGGVVNRVTKQPMFGPVREASLTAGSWGQLRGTLDVGDAFNAGAAAWRLNAMAEHAGSFRDGVELDRWALNPTLAVALGPRSMLTLGVEHLRDDRTADRGIPAQDGRPYETDPGTFFGNAEQSRARSTVDGAYAILDHDFGSGARLRNVFRVTHYDKFYQNVYPDNANASSVTAAGTMRLAAYNNANLRTNVFNQTDVTFRTTTASIEHALLAGVELGHQDSRNKRNTGFFGPLATDNLITVPATAPFATAVRFEPNGSDADNRVRADIFGVYVQDQVALAREWKLVGGVRYDVFRTVFDDRRTAAAPTDLARTDRGLSPRIGVLWSPTPTATYYASYSESFLPSGEQLSLTPNTADLAPERARNYEVGAHWEALPGLTASAAIFRLDRDDVRSPDPANPGLFVKTGQQRTEGFELGVQGEVTPSWRVYGGYSYLHGRIAETTSAAPAGATLQLVPDHLFALWNRVALGPSWAAGLGFVYQSNSFATLDNRVELPGFARTDAALYYAFAGGRASVAVNVENLFDRRYFPTADGNNNISPGAPRNVRVTLNAVF